MSAGPTLQDFVRQGRVLALYRNFVRATRPLPSLEMRRETLAWIRDDFERARYETNPENIESHLTHGQIQLKQIGTMIINQCGTGIGEPLRGTRNEKVNE